MTKSEHCCQRTRDGDSRLTLLPYGSFAKLLDCSRGLRTPGGVLIPRLWPLTPWYVFLSFAEMPSERHDFDRGASVILSIHRTNAPRHWALTFSLSSAGNLDLDFFFESRLGCSQVS